MVLINAIVTERLIIRKFSEDDWEDIYEYLSNEDVVKFEPYKIFSREESREEAIYRAKNNNFLAVCLKKTGKVIGNLYLIKKEYDNYQIGCIFNHNYWNNGYATESFNALIEYAFNRIKARRIIALCNPENIPSWKLLERVNMRREGCFKENIYFKIDENNRPIWQDTYEYAILSSEWKDKQHKNN